MLFAIGWAIVRSSREPFRELVDKHGAESSILLPALDAIDDAMHQADERLFDSLEAYLAPLGPSGFAWNFRRHMNNHHGILTFSTSTNHRTVCPWPIDVFNWLAANGPGSYGLAYIHDDEDEGDWTRKYGRARTDHRNEFRVWRLLAGKVEELDDPFLSPITPRINPNEYA